VEYSGRLMILALDTASPVVSVAFHGEIRTERSIELARSSRRLLEMVDEVLEEARVTVAELTGIVTLRGPGSFTGLRVGLATVMGLHQASGIPATAVPTLEVLAASAVQAGAEIPGDRIVAAVDVLRGEWAVQPFRATWPPAPETAAERVPADELARFLPAAFVGFGLDKLRREGGLETSVDAADTVFVDPPPLAAVAARLAATQPPVWDAGLLTEPLYFRPPPVTLPTRRPGAPRNKRKGRGRRDSRNRVGA